MASTMLHVRVADEVKAQATEALAAMGLSVSDAVLIVNGRGDMPSVLTRRLLGG